MKALGVLGLGVITVVLTVYALFEARAPLPPVPAFVGGGPSEPIGEGALAPATNAAIANAAATPSSNEAEAVTPAGKSGPTLRELAWHSLDAGEWDKARAQALECLATDKLNGGCRGALVASFSRRGLWEEGKPYVNECLQLDPANPTCLAAAAMYALKKDQPEEARRMVEALAATGDRSMDSYGAAAEYALAIEDNAAACTNFRLACAAGQSYACGKERELCKP